MEQKEGPQKILRYLQVMQKRKWTIISFVLIFFIIAVIENLVATPVYEATARILISTASPKVISIEEVLSPESAASDYHTQYQIITSRTVARKVVEKLNLENNPDILTGNQNLVNFIWRSLEKRIIQPVFAMMNSGESIETDSYAEKEAGSDLVRKLINRITVTPVQKSRLVDVSLQSKDPAAAAQMTNTLAQAYIEYDLEARLKATQNAIQWLKKRVDEQRSGLEKAEKALLTYKEENEIITGFASDAELITAQKLAKLNTQVVDAEIKRVETQTRYHQALKLKDSNQMLNAIPEVIDNKAIAEIKSREIRLNQKQSELSKKYGQNHPRMVAITMELEDLVKQKTKIIDQIINSLKNEYELALARENALVNAVSRQKERSLKMNQKVIRYTELKRQAEISRSMYDFLMTRFKETNITGEINTGNIRVIDRAEIPSTPIKPRKTRNILLAIALGLTLGAGLTFTVEFFDNSVKSAEELKEHFSYPYLGGLPQVKGKQNRSGPSDLIFSDQDSSNSYAYESLRNIRLNMQFSSVDHRPRVLMITSPDKGEGKTFFAVNLALAYARTDTKILLLDCDMRNPCLQDVFGCNRWDGISNALLYDMDNSEIIVQTDFPNLDIFPAGALPPNPTEILSSKRMKRLVEDLKSRYDMVIIDTPPLDIIPDALALAPLVDGAIIIACANFTLRPKLQNTLEKLEVAKCRVMGLVLNGITDVDRGYYYYGYTYSRSDAKA